MNFATLKNKFEEQAQSINAAADPTAKFRAAAYTRVANKLESIAGNTEVTRDAIHNLDISDYMKKRAEYFMDNPNKPGKSKAKQRAKSPTAKSPLTKSPAAKNSRAKSPAAKSPAALIKELSEFMGLGPEKAKALVAAGVKHVNQLHMKKYAAMLPEETKAFINLKPLQKIPNQDIKLLEPLITEPTDDFKLIITGSYRRGKPFSSDIDLQVISDKPDAINDVLEHLRHKLNGKVYPYSKGKDKMSLIVDTQNITETPAVYKIDVFRTSIADQIPMLLYSTGSKEFNISMRRNAKKLGYLLNQKGLFSNGNKIDLQTEADYFKILNMDYQEPNQRV